MFYLKKNEDKISEKNYIYLYFKRVSLDTLKLNFFEKKKESKNMSDLE